LSVAHINSPLSFIDFKITLKICTQNLATPLVQMVFLKYNFGFDMSIP